MPRKPTENADAEPQEKKATRLTNVNLSTVASRDKLKVRESIYWQKLDKGCHLGVRKMTAGSELWWAKYNLPGTTTVIKQRLDGFRNLARADQFGAAKKAAESWFKTVGRVGRVEPVTVKQACAVYVQHKLETEGSEPAAEIEGRFKRWIDDAPIGKIQLAKLTRTDVEGWRKAMVDTPVRVNYDEQKPIFRTRSIHTANRDLTPLRAALNYALGKDLVASDKAWVEELKPLVKAKPKRNKPSEIDDEDADLDDDANDNDDEEDEDSQLGHHNIELNYAQRTALIAAASAELRPLLHVMSMIPVRPGALARLRVRNLSVEKARVRIVRDKAGSGRLIPLPPETLAVFKGLAEGKPKNALLLPRSNGKRWTKDGWKKPVKAAVIAAGLPPEATIYTVRHSAITDLVQAGLDVGNVAKLAGTSIQMIDKHYFKLGTDRATAALAALYIEMPSSPPPPAAVDFGDDDLI